MTDNNGGDKLRPWVLGIRMPRFCVPQNAAFFTFIFLLFHPNDIFKNAFICLSSVYVKVKVKLTLNRPRKPKGVVEV